MENRQKLWWIVLGVFVLVYVGIGFAIRWGVLEGITAIAFVWAVTLVFLALYSLKFIKKI